jgi:hypothetical protein
VLGDCGLERLDLVSGGSGACDVYRTIPLLDVPVPEDGYLVLCASDSTLASVGACDLSTAGRSALKNGWLQNGPADGLRFVATSGGVVELAYEGTPSCFSSASVPLPEESGELDVDGASVDDVAVQCSGGYTLRPYSLEGLRSPNDCRTAASLPPDGAAPPPAPSTCAEGGCASGGAPAQTWDAGREPWVPELAPGTEPPVELPAFGPGLVLDAGASDPLAGVGDVPPAPGCTAGAVPPGTSSAGALLLAAASGLAALGRRRQP